MQLGDLLEQVDERNTDGSVTNLLGVAIDKHFMPSVANVIGTDLSKYKLVAKDRFACNPMHVGRDEKMPIARYDGVGDAIVSPAYFTFEASSKAVLPRYLELWFNRAEFDRRCWFATDASVRGGLSWDALCDIPIQLPSLPEQQAAVDRFDAIDRRISQLKLLNDKLADSIAALILNAQTDKQQTIDLGELCTLCSSKRIFASEYQVAGVPFFRGSEITALSKGQPLSGVLHISRSRFEEIRSRFGAPKRNDILLTAVGTIGNSYLVQDEEFYFKDGNVIWLKDVMPTCVFYLYGYMQTRLFADDLVGITIGSTQSALTIDALGGLQIPVPSEERLAEVNNACKSVLSLVSLGHAEIRALTTARRTMLSELGR